MTGGTVQFDKTSPWHIGEPIPGSATPTVQPPVVSPPVVSNTPPVVNGSTPAIEPPAVAVNNTPPTVPKLEATQQYLRDLKPDRDSGSDAQ